MTQTIPPRNTHSPRLADPRLVRLWNPETKRWLHMSGETETDKENYAWLGYKMQARVLRERATARGDGWPYQARKRT